MDSTLLVTVAVVAGVALLFSQTVRPDAVAERNRFGPHRATILLGWSTPGWRLLNWRGGLRLHVYDEGLVMAGVGFQRVIPREDMLDAQLHPATQAGRRVTLVTRPHGSFDVGMREEDFAALRSWIDRA